MTFVNQACWEEQDAIAILKTEALKGSDKLFLSTHFPITEFEVSGSQGSQVENRNEQGLLEVLSAPERDHVFCVVEGEPGSGKSHLIRWLKASWPISEQNLLLLVQRADGSLEGTLEQLRRKIPERFSNLFDGLGQRQDSTLAGRADDFRSMLVTRLRPGYFENKMLHDDWCGKYQVAEVLDCAAVREYWNAPGRILEIMSGRDSDSLSELARFTYRDILDLMDLKEQIRTARPHPMAIRFITFLDKERLVVERLIKKDVLSAEDRAEAEFATHILEALNARRDHAVQNLLGISSQGLRQLFLRLRKKLKEENMRLILLLEDITNFQGVDQQLIDALVTDRSTREDDDLCDLISVVGITPAYFDEYLRTLGNYVGRITHHVKLGTSSEETHHQDVANLKTKDSRVKFASKYLRAVRAGVEELENWSGEDQSTIRNRCIKCAFKDTCHKGFGQVDGIGLFPFTADAIDSMYERLEDPKGGHNPQTPRGLIQGILNPTLLAPDYIREGQFPSVNNESHWIPERKRNLTNTARAFLEAHIEHSDVRERFERLVSIWGNRLLPSAEKDTDDTFAGIHRLIYAAFDLPWITSYEAPDTASTKQTDAETETVKSVQSDSALTFRESSSTAKSSSTRKKSSSSGASKSRVKVQDLEKRRNQLQQWKKGESLTDRNFWNLLLFELLESLNWSYLGVSEYIRSTFFTKDLTKIEGTTGSAARGLFIVPAEDWLNDGLAAYLELKADSGDHVEHNRKKLARCLDLLGSLVIDRAHEVIPKLADTNKPWPAARSAWEYLAARSWLKSEIPFDDPPVEQWRKLASGEFAASADTSLRNAVWKRVVEAASSRASIWEFALELSALSEPAKDGSRFLDGQIGYQALNKLRETFEFSALPPDFDMTTQWTKYRNLRNQVVKIRDDLSKVVDSERNRLLGKSRQFDKLLYQQAVRRRLEQIRSVIEKFTEIIGGYNTDTLQKFTDAVWETQKLDSRDVTEFVDGALDAEQTDWSIYQTFRWVSAAPIAGLDTVLTALRLGDNLLNLSLEITRSELDSESGDNGGDVSTLRETSKRLKEVSERVQKILERV